MFQGNSSEMQSSLDVWSRILAIVRDIVFIAAIYLYFTGVTYRYYYYDHFGLKNLISEPTMFSAFVLSYGVIASHWMVILSIAILFIAIFMAARRRAPRAQRRIAGATAIIAALGMFPLLNLYAFEKAHTDARSDEIAAFNGKDTRINIAAVDGEKYSPYFLKAADGYDIRILARDEKNTYVLWQPSPDEGHGEVYVIPNDVIKYGEMVER